MPRPVRKCLVLRGSGDSGMQVCVLRFSPVDPRGIIGGSAPSEVAPQGKIVAEPFVDRLPRVGGSRLAIACNSGRHRPGIDRRWRRHATSAQARTFQAQYRKDGLALRVARRRQCRPVRELAQACPRVDDAQERVVVGEAAAVGRLHSLWLPWRACAWAGCCAAGSRAPGRTRRGMCVERGGRPAPLAAMAKGRPRPVRSGSSRRRIRRPAGCLDAQGVLREGGRPVARPLSGWLRRGRRCPTQPGSA